jgi:hypothetical protein
MPDAARGTPSVRIRRVARPELTAESNTMDAKKVLLIGLHPDVVDYSRWPGLTAEKLEAGLRRDESVLNDNGYRARICFVDHGETAEAAVSKELAEADYDCVLIGAGVRTDVEEFLLFEKLLNTVHEHAPRARICFNTGPTDSVDAVKRWV